MAGTKRRKTGAASGKTEARAEPPKLDGPAIAAIRRDLLSWYDRERRDLPWRRTQDPYRVWLSEIMLQQTRVETVIPYYERFLERFPTVSDLAEAPIDDVLARWSGLGYYRRARSLHEAAGQIVREHAGVFPEDSAEALALPGVGRYTAGAILSIAYGRPEPILDGNVIRILSRWLRLGPEIPQSHLWTLAEDLVPEERPGDFNQAMMELGATVCTPRSPSCLLCPVQERCEARAEGTPERYPAPKAKEKPVLVRSAVAVVVRRGRLLMCRPKDRTVLEGLWELPGVDLSPEEDAVQALASGLERRFGIAFNAETSLPEVKHSIMSRRIRLSPILGSVEGTVPRSTEAADLRWVLLRDVTERPIGGITRKILRRLESTRR